MVGGNDYNARGYIERNSINPYFHPLSHGIDQENL